MPYIYKIHFNFEVLRKTTIIMKSLQDSRLIIFLNVERWNGAYPRANLSWIVTSVPDLIMVGLLSKIFGAHHYQMCCYKQHHTASPG